MEIDVNWGIKELLTRAKAEKKRVVIHLENGESMSGPVGGVSEKCVVIKALAGREFFDAMITIESIVAVEVQARTS